MGGYISYSQNHDEERLIAIIKHLEYRVALLEGEKNPIPPKKSLPRLGVKLQQDIKSHKLKKVSKRKKDKPKVGGLFAELSDKIAHRRERIAPVTYPDVYTWEDELLKRLDGVTI